MRDLIDLFHEVGMLQHTPRSGFAFLGSGAQSVAEHSFRMTIIAFGIAKQLNEKVDLQKLLLICLFHDLPEARTGDLNYVNKRYVTANENKVITDLEKESRLGPEIAAYLNEYIANQTIEAKIAHDADQLELMLVLKKEKDLGNAAAQDWLDNVQQRLKLELSHKLAREILERSSDSWWVKDKNDPFWVNGK